MASYDNLCPTDLQSAQVDTVLGRDNSQFETLISHLMSTINEQRSQAEVSCLTNDDIAFLRTYLNLPSEIVPATLKKSAKPLGRPMGGPPGDRPRGPARFEGDRPRFGDRDGYRGGPRGPPGEFGVEKRGAPADYQPAFRMANFDWMIYSLVLSCLIGVYEASAGNSDPLYRSCVKQCGTTGCVGQRCFSRCKSSSDDTSLYLWWKRLDCGSDCRYHCMFDREKERAELGEGPVKYHGKWPFRRLCGFQEPLSMVFSALNLAVQFHGLRSF